MPPKPSFSTRVVNLKCWLCEDCSIELCSKHKNDKVHKNHKVIYIGMIPTQIQVRIKPNKAGRQTVGRFFCDEHGKYSNQKK